MTLSRRLGHTLITMTADRYVHPRDTALRDAAERMDELLTGNHCGLLLCEVSVTSDGRAVNLGDALLAAGLAMPYMPGDPDSLP